MSISKRFAPIFSKFNRKKDELFYKEKFIFFVPVEMISIKDSQNEQWDLFENAATYSYARSVLEKNKDKDNLIIDKEKQRRTKTTIE